MKLLLRHIYLLFNSQKKNIGQAIFVFRALVLYFSWWVLSYIIDTNSIGPICWTRRIQSLVSKSLQTNQKQSKR